MGLQLQLSKNCARESCKVLFDPMWAISMGLKLIHDKPQVVTSKHNVKEKGGAFDCSLHEGGAKTKVYVYM
jgi:hypothetical protein